MNWSVPRIWSGEVVAVIATGPSLTQDQVDRCVGSARLIAVCEAWSLVPESARPGAWLHACEFDELHRLPERDPYAWPGIKTTLVPGAAHDGVHLLQHTGETGFDPDPRYVRHGCGSGYQAAHIAVHAGARRIVLLGCDGRMGDHNRLHCHPQYIQGGRRPYQSTFPEWVRCWRTLAEPLRERGVEVVNCTPGSAVDAFGPVVPLEEALDQ